MSSLSVIDRSLLECLNLGMHAYILKKNPGAVEFLFPSNTEMLY